MGDRWRGGRDQRAKKELKVGRTEGRHRGRKLDRLGREGEKKRGGRGEREKKKKIGSRQRTEGEGWRKEERAKGSQGIGEKCNQMCKTIEIVM